jgi:membrane protein YdbS with pleckstrin-like domain
MSFPARLLNPGEEVVVDVHPHWRFLVLPVAASVVALAGSVATLILSAPDAAKIAVLAVLVVAVLWLGLKYLRWRTTSFVVTSFRIIDRHGILSKTGREIPLDHLSDISYRQSLFDRMIGNGDIVMESAGRDSSEVFADLPHPAQIQNQIYSQINRTKVAQYAPAPNPASGPSPAAGPSIPDQIGQLDQLRRQGVITAAEFEQKKAELLERM